MAFGACVSCVVRLYADMGSINVAWLSEEATGERVPAIESGAGSEQIGDWKGRVAEGERVPE